MNTNNKTVLGLIFALLAIGSFTLNASEIDYSHSSESQAIYLKGLKICHQRDWRNLSLNLEYTGEDVDSQAVASHVRAFLEYYSSPDDFWEVMNTNLVKSVSEAFPKIFTVHSQLKIDPDNALVFPRESVVDYEKRTKQFKEIFRFSKLNYLICQQSFRSLNLEVTWIMKNNPNPETDYPDYQWVDQAMELFFATHSFSASEWKALKPLLISHLLESFPAVESFDVEIRINE